MSNEQKVALARRAKSDDGLPPVLAALELSRSSRYYHQKHGRAYTEKYAHLKEPLEAIAREHPAYGYRRTTVELREVYGYKTNHPGQDLQQSSAKASPGVGFALDPLRQAAEAERGSASDHGRW